MTRAVAIALIAILAAACSGSPAGVATPSPAPSSAGPATAAASPVTAPPPAPAATSATPQPSPSAVSAAEAAQDYLALAAATNAAVKADYKGDSTTCNDLAHQAGVWGLVASTVRGIEWPADAAKAAAELAARADAAQALAAETATGSQPCGPIAKWVISGIHLDVDAAAGALRKALGLPPLVEGPTTVL